MKKWKLLSLALTTFLLLGLCVVGVFAADVTAITAESLAGHQAPNYIVSDLTLPEGITWSSDNPDVISNDGRVSRLLSDDAAVTLTGNDGVNEKSFSFTVKAMTTQVIDQENFYYPDKVDQAGSQKV
ncbi:MAG: immunoglobulin-like domain-containing protein, partial [Clostridia bacterium]